MSDKLSDEQIEAAKTAGFSWHPIWQCLVVRHSNGAWSEVSDKLARFAALLAASPAPAISESEDARDAERYRWLRDKHDGDGPAAAVRCLTGPFFNDAIHGERLDAAIDAARKGEK